MRVHAHKASRDARKGVGGIEGVNFIRGIGSGLVAGSTGMELALLLRRENLEIMRQTILPDATIWISPAQDADMMEFFYVLSGSLTLDAAGERHDIKTGESFYVEALKQDLRIVTTERTEVLYVANRLVFDDLLGFQSDLNELLLDINNKDNVTRMHSRNVMRYSVKLYEQLDTTELSMDELVTASLFHDVGKRFTPDEILKKKSFLTPEEYQYIKYHAADGEKILLSRFGERVARIARSHHERLDGSGYPDGLRGEQIPFCSRIIAVADSYDAMTSPRSYNRVKTPEEAVRELAEMSDKYDARIVATLAKLLADGELDEDHDSNV